jgi:hypothetical protein
MDVPLAQETERILDYYRYIYHPKLDALHD